MRLHWRDRWRVWLCTRLDHRWVKMGPAVMQDGGVPVDIFECGRCHQLTTFAAMPRRR